MDEMTYATFIQEAFKRYAVMQSEERVGQSLMNTLWEFDRNLYAGVAASLDTDCFFVDENVPEFLAFVKANWNC